MSPALSPAQAAALRLNAAAVLGQDRLRDFDADREWRRAQDMGLRLLFRDEPGFPELLRSVADAPLVLYVQGRFEPERDALAFVGSRQPTPYGRRMTRQLVREAAARFVITSGLARGIDTEAHRAALDSAGRPGRSWATVWGASTLRRTRLWPGRSPPATGAS